jgi:hypothetical protein
VLRSVTVIAASMALAFAFLAACNGGADDADDGISLDDDPATPLDDRTRADDDEVADDDTDDMGAARTDDDLEDPGGPSAGEHDDEDGPERISDYVDVALEDFEIEMEDTADSGIVGFILSNEGDHEHGISIVPAGSDDGEEQILGTMLVEPGEEEQLEQPS